jgi:hypothetical protein
LAAGLPTSFTLTAAMTKRRGPGFFERIADQMREFADSIHLAQQFSLIYINSFDARLS